MGFEEFIGVNLWTALFVLLNTLTIFFVGRKYLFGPVSRMIESRQQEIDDMYRDASDAKQRAGELESEYQTKLSEAVQTGERIVKEATARGHAREEEIVSKANREAAAILDKASQDIAMEKKKAVNEAKSEISGLALEIAGKVVGKSLTDSDQAGLVDSFIEELGDGV